MLSSKEISSQLSIATSTLRKYSQLFERLEYEFTRNTKHERIYSEKDVHLLKSFLNRKSDNPRLTNEEVIRELLNISKQQHLNIEDRQIDVLLRLENDIRECVINQQQVLKNIETHLDSLRNAQIEILKKRQLHTTEITKLLMDFKADILEITKRKGLFKK